MHHIVLQELTVHELFIYGTLMPGLRLEAEMQGAERLGLAQVPGRLVDVGRYPGLLHGEGLVAGEVPEWARAVYPAIDPRRFA